MSVQTMPRPDLVALGSDDEPILVGELNAHRIDRAGIERLKAILGTSVRSVEFGLLVDRETIRLYRWNGHDLGEPIVEHRTQNVLQFYDPKFGQKKVSSDYFEALVEAWLRDVAYHWKASEPPLYHELVSVGLAERLRGGTTRVESLTAE